MIRSENLWQNDSTQFPTNLMIQSNTNKMNQVEEAEEEAQDEILNVEADAAAADEEVVEDAAEEQAAEEDTAATKEDATVAVAEATGKP